VSRPSVVVVGGGYAGIAVAKGLDEIADVVLVEPKDAFVHNVAALRALVDPSWLERTYFPYDTLLSRGRVVRASAVKVEPTQVVLSTGESLTADYVVLATGSTYPFPAKSDELDMADAHDKVRRAHDALAAATSVLLVGAGPVGIELAGEIVAVWPDKQVTLLDQAPELLGPRYKAELKAELGRQLAELGVRVVLGEPLRTQPATQVGVRAPLTVTTTGGTTLEADIWFRCYGVAPASGYLVGDLIAARTPDGFLQVTPQLQVEGQERVFSLGDVSTADAQKLAGLAGRQAAVVVANISELVSGGTDLQTYDPIPPALIVPIGPTGGAGQLPGQDEIASADLVSQMKGRDLSVEQFAALFR
jgi:NADH dehydrogenase FAD-containing subunit